MNRAEALPTSNASPRSPRVDAPLRVKVTLLVMLAAVGGALVGMFEADTGHTVFPLAGGLLLLVSLLLTLGKAWVWRPLERLVEHLGLLSQDHRPLPFRGLPLDRRDEVGELARALHKIASWAMRDHLDAAQLRRTLDDRVAKAIKRATVQLAQIAMRDPLTNLGNRRFLDAHLEPLLESCKQSGDELLAMAIDLDDFKRVNDQFGHARGDEVLAVLAAVIRANIRQGSDYAVRMGGDEFVILMPGCPLDRAAGIARQLIALFARYAATEFSPTLNPSLSVGIASLKRDAPGSGKDLLARADANLYAAKRAGKGRCVGA